MRRLSAAIDAQGPLADCPMLILCDDSGFMSEELSNFLWATFTRSNPSHDIYGVNSRVLHKHWSCDNVIIDARVKPHQAPPLIPDPEVQRNIERLFEQGGSLSSIRK
jgi:4-hydroxy-3-polyprenylbenzoate decarboxylase